ncbi:MAG: phage portal protein [Phycisphaeraceae bacterium]|nr:phage portal protein [Phycisphaeraceae bacterium]MCB9848787.1 phage portal protein [Phycisphaeraceae bacterium]
MLRLGRRNKSRVIDRSPSVRSVLVRRSVRAGYDSAVTNDGNRRHWAGADGLSADAAASPEVRRLLRNRARYEVANNSYARGIVLTLANDAIGTGPRLQMLTDDPEANAVIERVFARWATAVGLPETLRTMRMARAEDGEAFAVLASNPELNSPVTLDVRLVEADQVTTPDLSILDDNAIDGIVFDRFGNPTEYHILKSHPGGSRTGLLGLEFDRAPAESVIHYFRTDRPGQSRGVPDITPALPLFAQLRRYTLAVLGAAETAADFAGVLYTDAPASGEADPVEPMDAIELEARALLTMPSGWRMEQVKAEQPSTTYAEFKREILNEIARCLNMPFNVAAGNSSGYNFASGRLDHQVYFKSIRVEQEHLARVVLDRVLNAFLREAVLVSGLLPLRVRTLIASDETPLHQWFWDGHEHVDPVKEANAQATRLTSHTTTLASEYARQGRDWESELRQRAKESALMAELGLTTEDAQPALNRTGGRDAEAEDE